MEVEARRATLLRERYRVIGDEVISRSRTRRRGGYLIAKRLLDIILSMAALILLSPLFAFVALMIKLDSAGPVFYRRKVVAQNGRSPHPIDPENVHTFDAFKFRTMCPDADSVLASDPELLREYLKDFKLDNDPRITRAGAFLRKTNLDELPQFLNVLLGQMSMVGPRIITPPEIEKYGTRSRRLLTVRPGVSGLWQVLRSGNHSYERRVKIDMAYIRRRNIWLDLRVIWQTVGLAVGKRGSG